MLSVVAGQVPRSINAFNYLHRYTVVDSSQPKT